MKKCRSVWWFAGQGEIAGKAYAWAEEKVELFYFASSPAVYIVDSLVLQMLFWKDQWSGRMSFAKTGATAFFKKCSCEVTSCWFYLPTQWWVELVTAQQDGSKARNVLLQQVSSPHPTSPHFISPKLAGRLNYPALGSVSLQSSLHSLCAETIKADEQGRWPSAAYTAPLQGLPILKIHVRFDFLMQFMGNLKLRGICKGRIAHMTWLLFTQGYVMCVSTSPARAPLPASTGLDAPLGMTQSLTGNSPNMH